MASCAEVPGANGQANQRRQRARNLGEPSDRPCGSIPLHAKISNLLAKRICRKLSIPDPHGRRLSISPWAFAPVSAYDCPCVI